MTISLQSSFSLLSSFLPSLALPLNLPLCFSRSTPWNTLQLQHSLGPVSFIGGTLFLPQHSLDLWGPCRTDTSHQFGWSLVRPAEPCWARAYTPPSPSPKPSYPSVTAAAACKPCAAPQQTFAGTSCSSSFASSHPSQRTSHPCQPPPPLQRKKKSLNPRSFACPSIARLSPATLHFTPAIAGLSWCDTGPITGLVRVVRDRRRLLLSLLPLRLRKLAHYSIGHSPRVATLSTPERVPICAVRFQS